MTIMQKVYWVIATLGNLIAINYMLNNTGLFPSLVLMFTLFYTVIGYFDIFHSPHTLNRLYPVVAYLRYFLESYRVEIQQYFIANDTEETPFNREQRSLVYQRAKNVRDTIAFGTQRDLLEDNYLSLWQSLHPKEIQETAKRVLIGGPDCLKPYQASYFNISAMSFGSLSSNAIESLNLGALKAGCYHNTGEGGVSPYHLKHQGDIVWQIGSGLFGCRDEKGNFNPESFRAMATRPQIKMIEIKLSQGAKPGHGGVLPKAKITDEIAAIRHIPKDRDCVSPAVNPECTTPKDLLNFVKKLRDLSEGKPVGFKLCVGNPVEFLGLCKAMIETGITPDFITVDGAEGGTGAAPVEFTNRLGMMCLEAVYFVHNALVGAGLRDNIRIIASGKTASSFDLLAKIAMGADTVNAARTMMMSLGCIQSRHCNTNMCPTGIATQDPARSKAINVSEKSERVKNYHKNTLNSFFELVGSMGLDSPDKLQPHMLKRRTPYGLLMSVGSLIEPLKVNDLLNENELAGPWNNWWHMAQTEDFYSEDTYILSPAELSRTHKPT
ncbi:MULTISPECIES: FMN-binding glutamate synthase family protein [unclassified Shewanella]|uniref:FMN-binding glutamate synthase family protein n=1 Tax=unclassified Shewanella TaxID=196818 RepID=UPI001BBD8256|nr:MULTISPECIES: FMN-binding glutamate synthase family protein [unclassified Shewanella]GIU07953.1 FMN-binding glutamate synthase family protein [Shewanella sp. MBTL60-112-B1]GIU30631.1 FMN-binding glutamate synthase family protein [Shewanella sp. MBTL60-112-B2]